RPSSSRSAPPTQARRSHPKTNSGPEPHAEIAPSAAPEHPSALVVGNPEAGVADQAHCPLALLLPAGELLEVSRNQDAARDPACPLLSGGIRSSTTSTQFPRRRGRESRRPGRAPPYLAAVQGCPRRCGAASGRRHRQLPRAFEGVAAPLSGARCGRGFCVGAQERSASSPLRLESAHRRVESLTA